MAQNPEQGIERQAQDDLSHLPPLRADHIPEDVLAQEHAEVNMVDPEVIDPLAPLSGVPEDVLSELDAAGRSASGSGLIPTDEEVLDLTSGADPLE
jgi:hypothetical protein